jgi:hypothetical protein
VKTKHGGWGEAQSDSDLPATLDVYWEEAKAEERSHDEAKSAYFAPVIVPEVSVGGGDEYRCRRSHISPLAGSTSRSPPPMLTPSPLPSRGSMMHALRPRSTRPLGVVPRWRSG